MQADSTQRIFVYKSKRFEIIILNDVTNPIFILLSYWERLSFKNNRGDTQSLDRCG